jgi:hypothetical protein
MCFILSITFRNHIWIKFMIDGNGETQSHSRKSFLLSRD